MADDLDIMDEEDQTLALDDDEDIEIDEEEGEDFEDEDDDDDLEDDDLEPIRPPSYKAESNVYTIFLVLSFIAFAIALGLVLSEMKDYCDPNRFMWGMFK